MPWWVAFKTSIPYYTRDHHGEDCMRIVSGFCVDSGTEEQARVIASDAAVIGEIASVKRLPYPAGPRLHGPVENDCPSFCRQPEKCAGLGSCPREYACDD